ncbi:MAG: TlpA family protein disulfide reductase, partial [Bacteroidetes bacterium]
MNHKPLLLLLILFLLPLAAAEAQQGVPDLVFRTLDGEEVRLKQLVGDGRPRILSFWATWCAPCKRELDAIAGHYAEWQRAYGVEVIAVSIDSRRALSKVPELVESKGWPYRIFVGDEREIMGALGFQTIPQTYLIDGQGRIVKSHSGYQPGDELKLLERLKEL